MSHKGNTLMQIQNIKSTNFKANHMQKNRILAEKTGVFSKLKLNFEIEKNR